MADPWSMIELPEITISQKRLIYLLFGVALAFGALFFLLAQGDATASPKPMISLPPISSPTPLQSIVVDVAGKVLHPGIYTLPVGSRANDALVAAGNALKGVSLTDINLAHVLVDGEQIIVGAPPIVVSKSSNSGKVTKLGKSSKVIININQASEQALQQLAGVGPVMASKIVAYRKAHGNFTSIDGIAKVPGFGSAKFLVIKSQLRI